MVRLVVACGGGIFTTTMVSDQVKDIMKKAGIQCTVTPAKLTEIAGIADADLIIVTGKFGTKTNNVANTPIIIGMSLVTGVGSEKFAEELVQKVKEIEEAK
ncbi:MAG: PTS sorbitol IIB subunit [Clostridia bacterium]|nr:PTS sorbitol IIB subunit [Clostridia bacterium]MDD4048284.1 PTS sorbitol IIB subunit [Clostridia bacterium]